jgi:hypothetical protein
MLQSDRGLEISRSFANIISFSLASQFPGSSLYIGPDLEIISCVNKVKWIESRMTAPRTQRFHFNNCIVTRKR